MEELIQKVRPDVVVLELCKDRTALLVPKERSFTCWLPSSIDFIGLPDREVLGRCLFWPLIPFEMRGQPVDCIGSNLLFLSNFKSVVI